MKTIIQLILFPFSTHLLIAQIGADMPPSAEPGKCYSKCLIPSAYNVYDIQIPVFYGDSSLNVVFDTLYFANRKRVHREFFPIPKADLNKYNADEIEIILALDTTTSKKFILEKIQCSEHTSSARTEWREIICASQITIQFMRNLRNALEEQGYQFQDVPPSSKIMGTEVKNALRHFQANNYLPIGSLDLETLAALGLETW